uniref:Uncharacterized protein n=1 Tax=Oryza rufipogon TaxID=4529 RepID=A0A0E0MZM7_ORYRU
MIYNGRQPRLSLPHLPLPASTASVRSASVAPPPSGRYRIRPPPVADPIRRLAAQLRLRSPHSLSQTRRLLIPVLRRNLRPPPRRHRSPSPVQRRAHPSTTTTTTTPPADPDIAAVPPPAKSVRPPPQPASPPLSLHRGNRHASPQPPPIRSHAAVPPPLKVMALELRTTPATPSGSPRLLPTGTAHWRRF